MSTVDAPDVAALTESFTILGWIKPTALGGHQQILSASRENSENGYAFKVRDNQLGFSSLWRRQLLHGRPATK